MSSPMPPSLPERTPSCGHEPTDVSPPLVSVAALTLALAVAMILGGLAWLLVRFQAALAQRDPPRNPLYQEQRPPKPQLDPDPPAELRRWRAEQEAKRSGYARIEGQSAFVSIPVVEAIEILARRGFPEPKGQPASPADKEAAP